MAIDLKSIAEKRRLGFTAEKATEGMGLPTILESLAEATEDLLRNHIPRISETLFVNRYLDAFAGVGENVEANYAIYLEWIMDIAGNYNVPVHVCDDRSREILFTVPATSNVETVNPAKSNTREIKTAIDIANDARFLQPFNWEAILQNNLAEVYKKIYDPTKAVLNKEQEAWLGIFERYKDRLATKKRINITPELAVEKQEQTQENPAQPTSTSYDEVDEPI